MSIANQVTIFSNGNMPFIFEKEVLKKSPYLLDKSANNDNINLPEVNSDTLQIVYKYLDYYKDKTETKIPEILANSDLKSQISHFDFELVECLPFDDTFHLINAAALLQLDHLHDLACAKIAAFMKDKTVEDVNKHFTFECQLTTDEAKELGLEIDENI